MPTVSLVKNLPELFTCEFYVLCTNGTARGTAHPILGTVPTCSRCSHRHGLRTFPLPAAD
jgi:hypothetical protein